MSYHVHIFLSGIVLVDKGLVEGQISVAEKYS